MESGKRDTLALTVGFLMLIGLVSGLLYTRSAINKPKPSLKSNMYSVQVALEDFSQRTAGYYPIDINISVRDVLNDLGRPSEDSSSIAGATRPALLTSSKTPPTSSPEVRGIVFYVPLDVEGPMARRYKICGVAREGF